jgi:hypothetical protein
MSYTGTSSLGFVPEVHTIISFKISCLTSLNISFYLHASNFCWGVVFFMTHWCWYRLFFATTSLVLAPPLVTILIFFLSYSLVSIVIHWTFWFFWFLFSYIFTRSLGSLLSHDLLCDNTYMSMVAVENTLRNVRVFGNFYMLLFLYLLHILFLHIFLLWSLLCYLDCLCVMDYTVVPNFIVDTNYFTKVALQNVAHYYTIVAL